VTGTLLASDHDRQAVEVRADHIDVVGHCNVEVTALHCAQYTLYTI